MKVVIATPFYPPQVGVLATYAAGIETALRHQGHDVVVVVMDLTLPAGLRHIMYGIRVAHALRNASFMLVLDTWSVAVPASVAALIRGVPFILRVGGDFLWEQYVERTGHMVRLSDFYAEPRPLSLKERGIRLITEWLTRRAAHVFFNTNFQKDLWASAYRISATRSSVLENYYPPHAPASPASRRVFVSANRSAAYKNTILLERAFEQVRKRHPDIELETAAVPYDAQMKRLARSYAAIIPSVSEVGSNIAIESVSFGRPFIMPEDTGTKERLADCGLFVDTSSQAVLESAIEKLLDTDTYNQLSARASSFSFVRTWDDIVSDLLRVVQRI